MFRIQLHIHLAFIRRALRPRLFLPLPFLLEVGDHRALLPLRWGSGVVCPFALGVRVDERWFCGRGLGVPPGSKQAALARVSLEF
jgi:hypothetical protein